MFTENKNFSGYKGGGGEGGREVIVGIWEAPFKNRMTSPQLTNSHDPPYSIHFLWIFLNFFTESNETVQGFLLIQICLSYRLHQLGTVGTVRTSNILRCQDDQKITISM